MARGFITPLTVLIKARFRMERKMVSVFKNLTMLITLQVVVLLESRLIR